METYLGLDLGGTKLLIGEMDSRGNILRYKKYDSGYFNQQAALEIIKSSLDDYIRTVGWYDQKPVAMGVGLIGRVDSNEGVWLQIDPSRTQRIELAKELSDIYGMPCHIDNDVKSATRAERVWGFGQISKNFIYVNVGTGIAVGTVINGRQIRGSHFNAGEVGHVRVGVNIGIKCGCGRMDCVEAIAAGIGFDNCARLLRKGGGIVADGYMHEKILEKLHPTTMRFVSNGVVITKLNPGFIGLLGAGAVAMNM